jgi:hypothetical protein
MPTQSLDVFPFTPTGSQIPSTQASKLPSLETMSKKRKSISQTDPYVHMSPEAARVQLIKNLNASANNLGNKL